MGKQPGRPSLGHGGVGGWEPPVSCTLTSPWGPSSVFPSEPLPVPGPIRCSKQALDLFILPCPQPAGNTCHHLLRSMGSADQTQQRNGHSYDFLFVSLDTSHFRGHPSFAHIDIFLTILPVLFIRSHSSLPSLSVQTRWVYRSMTVSHLPAAKLLLRVIKESSHRCIWNLEAYSDPCSLTHNLAFFGGFLYLGSPAHLLYV